MKIQRAKIFPNWSYGGRIKVEPSVSTTLSIKMKLQEKYFSFMNSFEISGSFGDCSNNFNC